MLTSGENGKWWKLPEQKDTNLEVIRDNSSGTSHGIRAFTSHGIGAFTSHGIGVWDVLEQQRTYMMDTLKREWKFTKRWTLSAVKNLHLPFAETKIRCHFLFVYYHLREKDGGY